MNPTFHRQNKITIFLPNNLLENEDTLLLKTIKIGIFSRLFTIFRVDEVIFYENQAKKSDKTLLKELFHYLNRAPYLRKYVKKKDNLKFVGVLPPIQSPNHLGIKMDNIEYKEGIIIDLINKTELKEIKIDIGDEKPRIIELNSISCEKLKKNDIITVKIEDNQIIFENPENQGFFWRYNTIISNETIKNLLENLEMRENIIIGASKEGEIFSAEDFNSQNKNKNGTCEYILLFGPLKGSFKDYLMKKKINFNLINQWYNFIPNQGTKTIKLEEAVISTLSALNLLI